MTTDPAVPPQGVRVNVVLGLVVVLVVTTLSVVAMLLVRRHAPEGSYFSDGDRASGVFGVLAAGFSILLGFIIFLTFQSYDDARLGAEAEATVVAQQVQTAQLMPGEARGPLTGQLVCYARSVVGVEWDAVDAGTLSDAINPWGAKMIETVSPLHPTTFAEQSAYDRWLEQTGERQRARDARIHSADGVVPSPVWVALLLICLVIFAYLLFFADSAEGAVTQALLMGAVTSVLTVLMLLVVFFDHPHGSGAGRLRPTAMQRALRLVDAQLEVVGAQDVNPPCDSRGVAR